MPSRTLTDQVCLLLATGLGLGYSPVAPGTVGALWGIPLTWLVMQIPSLATQILILVGLYAVGVAICDHAAKLMDQKDPGSVVWDEIATVPLVFLLVNQTLVARPEILLLGFVLHRVFDITKFPPIHRLERLPGGLGIMTDDVVAALYGCCAMHVILLLLRLN